MNGNLFNCYTCESNLERRTKMKKGILCCLLFILSIYSIATIFFEQKYTNADFNIETYQSKMDKDQDGIDDQTDILENTKQYLATKPKYKSKYYATGYPNDEYGVCTDVVGFSLLNAGYDLKELVNLDIIENQTEYNINQIDKNIDFRRVKNLQIYFQNMPFL